MNKLLIFILLLLFSVSLSSQTDLSFRASINVFNVSGTAPNFTIHGFILDGNNGYYSSDSTSLTDVIYVASPQGCVQLSIDTINSKVGGILDVDVTDLNGVLATVPKGIGAVLSPTSNNYPTSPYAAPEPIRSCLLTDLANKIDGSVNNLQSQISDLPSGSGTTNYLVRWTPNGNTLGNAGIVDNGTFLQFDRPVAFKSYTTAGRPTGAENRFIYDSSFKQGFYHDGTSYRPFGEWFRNGSNIYYTGGNITIGSSVNYSRPFAVVGTALFRGLIEQNFGGASLNGNILFTSGDFSTVAPTRLLYTFRTNAIGVTSTVGFYMNMDLGSSRCVTCEQTDLNLNFRESSSTRGLVLSQFLPGNNNSPKLGLQTIQSATGSTNPIYAESFNLRARRNSGSVNDMFLAFEYTKDTLPNYNNLVFEFARNTLLRDNFRIWGNGDLQANLYGQGNKVITGDSLTYLLGVTPSGRVGDVDAADVGKNFANTDLTFTNSRFHNASADTLQIDSLGAFILKGTGVYRYHDSDSYVNQVFRRETVNNLQNGNEIYRAEFEGKRSGGYSALARIYAYYAGDSITRSGELRLAVADENSFGNPNFILKGIGNEKYAGLGDGITSYTTSDWDATTMISSGGGFDMLGIDNDAKESVFLAKNNGSLILGKYGSGNKLATQAEILAGYLSLFKASTGEVKEVNLDTLKAVVNDGNGIFTASNSNDTLPSSMYAVMDDVANPTGHFTIGRFLDPSTSQFDNTEFGLNISDNDGVVYLRNGGANDGDVAFLNLSPNNINFQGSRDTYARGSVSAGGLTNGISLIGERAENTTVLTEFALGFGSNTVVDTLPLAKLIYIDGSADFAMLFGKNQRPASTKGYGRGDTDYRFTLSQSTGTTTGYDWFKVKFNAGSTITGDNIQFYNNSYQWKNGTPSTTLNDTTIHAWIGTGSAATPAFIPYSVSGGGGSGEANTASNLGSGEGLFTTKTGVNLPFKSLTAGDDIALSSSSTEVNIDFAAQTADRVLVTDGSGEVGTDAGITYSTSSNALSVFSGSITANSSDIYVSTANTDINITSSGNINSSRYIGTQFGTNLLFTKGRGTAASPANVNVGDYLGTIGWYGYNGTMPVPQAWAINAIVTDVGAMDADLAFSNGASNVFVLNGDTKTVEHTDYGTGNQDVSAAFSRVAVHDSNNKLKDVGFTQLADSLRNVYAITVAQTAADTILSTQNRLVKNLQASTGGAFANNMSMQGDSLIIIPRAGTWHISVTAHAYNEGYSASFGEGADIVDDSLNPILGSYDYNIEVYPSNNGLISYSRSFDIQTTGEKKIGFALNVIGSDVRVNSLQISVHEIK